MIMREMTQADRAQALGWMGERYEKPFPLDFFPQTGVAVEDGAGRLLAVIPVYFEESSAVAVAGHCMANPANVPRESRAAVETAMRGTVRYAMERGRKYLVTIYGNRGVNRIADKMGFVRADVVEEKFITLR